MSAGGVTQREKKNFADYLESHGEKAIDDCKLAGGKEDEGGTWDRGGNSALSVKARAEA